MREVGSRSLLGMPLPMWSNFKYTYGRFGSIKNLSMVPTLWAKAHDVASNDTTAVNLDKSFPQRNRHRTDKRSSLPRRIGRHLLHHSQHQLAVAVIQAHGVAADLAEKADFIIGELRQSLAAVGVASFGEKLGESNLHGAGD